MLFCTHEEGKERNPQTLTIHLFVYWFVGTIMSFFLISYKYIFMLQYI